jgi:hypothetical protein
MPISRPKFISLEELTRDWAAQDGAPAPLVLRRICDWAFTGAFPEGTFVLSNGNAVDLLTLHQAMRAVIGLRSPIDHAPAVQLIEETLVTVAGIRTFCAHLDIEPPRRLGSKRPFLRAFSKQLLSGPPDCPEAAGIGVRADSKMWAIAAIRTLLSLIEQFRDHAGAIPEHAAQAWTNEIDSARHLARLAQDTEIEAELEALDRKWEELKGNTPAISNVDISQPADVRDSVPVEPKKRAPGRPVGSGSLESQDHVIAEQMHIGIERRQYLSITAAAKAFAPQAGGAGTLASKEKRLIRRYAELYPV